MCASATLEGEEGPFNGKEARAQPSAKDAKINIKVFTRKDFHKGVKSMLKHWARGFRDEIDMAQQSCKYWWVDSLKISLFEGCLRGELKDFVFGLQDEW